MSWIMSAIIGVAALGSGAKEAYENHWFKKQIEEFHGIEYYYDRNCRTYERRTGKEIRVDRDHIEYVDHSGVLYDKYEEMAKESRKKEDGLFCLGTCSRVNGEPSVVIHRPTGKQIARIVKENNGECRAYFFYDLYTDLYPAKYLSGCMKVDHWSINSKDPNNYIVITDEEFENVWKSEELNKYVYLRDWTSKTNRCNGKIV